MPKKRTRNIFNQSDYKIISELYYLNKGEIKVPRLPLKDRRRVTARKINREVPMSFRKVLLRIAAIW